MPSLCRFCLNFISSITVWRVNFVKDVMSRSSFILSKEDDRHLSVISLEIMLATRHNKFLLLNNITICDFNLHTTKCEVIFLWFCSLFMLISYFCFQVQHWILIMNSFLVQIFSVIFYLISSFDSEVSISLKLGSLIPNTSIYVTSYLYISSDTFPTYSFLLKLFFASNLSYWKNFGSRRNPLFRLKVCACSQLASSSSALSREV